MLHLALGVGGSRCNFDAFRPQLSDSGNSALRYAELEIFLSTFRPQLEIMHDPRAKLRIAFQKFLRKYNASPGYEEKHLFHISLRRDMEGGKNTEPPAKTVVQYFFFDLK